jgi:hypothetical protein
MYRINRIAFFVLCLASVQSGFCMEQSYQMETERVRPSYQITQWPQVARLAGELVTYTTLSDYFIARKAMCTSVPNQKTRYYGYVKWNPDEREYTLHPLLLSTAKPINYLLSNDKIVGGDLYMRSATLNEKTSIHKILNGNKGKFGLIDEWEPSCKLNGFQNADSFHFEFEQ